MAGPQIKINIDNGDLDKKLTALKQNVRLARAELSAINREMDNLARKGQQISKTLVVSAEMAEDKLDAAKGALSSAREGPEQGGSGRPSYGFAKWQSQFANHGSLGRHQSALTHPTPEGFALGLAQLAGGTALVKLVTEVLRLPETIKQIQSIAFDYDLAVKAAGPGLNPTLKRAMQYEAERKILGALPVVGGTLGALTDASEKVSELIHNEEDLPTVRARQSNRERMQALGMGEQARRNEVVRANVGRLALFTNYYRPTPEETAKELTEVEKLVQQGIEQASKGNLRGRLDKGGEGGAQDFFSRANKIMPQMTPLDAASAYQALEQARIADRNFARSQMARAGPRTGD